MLCPTAQLIVSTLEGSSEASLLLSTSGLVLYKNPEARTRLFATDEEAESISSLLDFAQPWDDVLAIENQSVNATVLKKDGTTPPVDIVVTKLGGCPCCDAQYVCLYIHEKREKQDVSSLNRIRDTVDASFDPMFTVNETGTIVMANTAAMKLFGYTRDEFIGNNISMICGGGHAAHHDKYMQNYMETGIKKIIGRKREVPAKRKDGSEFPVELGINEIQSNTDERYFCGFIKDLSEQKRHEKELQYRSSLAQGMINASFDPMFEIDERGTICLVNQAACSLFGWTQQEFVGNNISMICGGGHGENHNEYIQRYLQTGEKRIIGRKRQCAAKRKDGKEIEIELGVQEVLSSNGERAFCGYIRDLTQQKMDKRQLRKNAAVIHAKFFHEGREEDGA